MLLINGEWVAGAGALLQSVSPADGAIVWETNAASSTQVHEAFQAAKQALPQWSSLPVASRIRCLKAFAGFLAENQGELADRIAKEIGKPHWEAMTEVKSCIAKVDISLQAAEERQQAFSRETPWGAESLHYAPLGPLLVLGPYNFPAHLPGGHIIPALLAGNTVVFKPSDKASWVGEWLTHAWKNTGLPPGVFNLILGGAEVAQAAIDSPDLAGVLFTGSYRTGQQITRQLASRPEVLLALEMGGNNPLVVLDPDDIPASVTLTILSAYLSAGQRCTCARRLIVVDSSRGREFVARLTQQLPRIRCGLPDAQPQPMIGPLVSREAASDVLAHYQKLIARRAIPLVPMEQDTNCPALLTPGLLDISPLTSPPEDTEIFGPLLQVSWATDFSAAIAQANATRYGLAAGLIGGTRQEYHAFRTSVRAGVFSWNRPMTGASGKLPFGGVGQSGNHRPSGYFASDYCTYPVAAQESDALVLPADLPPGLELGAP